MAFEKKLSSLLGKQEVNNAFITQALKESNVTTSGNDAKKYSTIRYTSSAGEDILHRQSKYYFSGKVSISEKRTFLPGGCIWARKLHARGYGLCLVVVMPGRRTEGGGVP